MAYINKGDLLEVNGHLAVAVSDSYTKMVYDQYDMELCRAGFEGGTAVGFVNVTYSDSLKTAPVELGEVTKIVS